jgi:hypothetical protein
MVINNIVRTLLGAPATKTNAVTFVCSSLSVVTSWAIAIAQSSIDALSLHADAHLSDVCAFSDAVAKGHTKYAVSIYC